MRDSVIVAIIVGFIVAAVTYYILNKKEGKDNAKGKS